MNFIIYDLEATCWQGNPLSRTQEIIEIGAVKVNSYGEETGSFEQFVQPILHPRLSAFCTELTSIEQRQIDRAKDFIEVVEYFQDWAEIFEEDYMLCSWGGFDRRMLIQDCHLHDLDIDWIEDHHINIKKQYHDIKRLRKPRGLKRTVEKEGFEFTGIHHRGISDAENLAKIFVKYLDVWRF